MTHVSVALIGPKGAGKSTLAAFLAQEHGYHRLSFADPLRALAAWAYGPVDKEQLYTVRHGDQEEVMSGRTLLQRLGTEAIRAFDEEFWLRCAARTLDENSGPWVIDDCRFPNERRLLAERGFLLVRLDGRGDMADAHASEAHWRAMAVHAALDNSRPFLDVARELERLIGLAAYMGKS